MKQVLLLTPVLLLASCEVFQGYPVFAEPKHEDIVGTYSVAKVSWSMAQRRAIKRVSLHLFKDGTYQLENRDPNLATPLLPGVRGTWHLKLEYDLDLGSRESWTVSLSSTNQDPKRAFCLKDEHGPYKLEIMSPNPSRTFDDFLVLEKNRE